MIIMSVDLGAARTGLAVCDGLESLASPLGVIQETYLPNLLKKAAGKARECHAGMIVVGHPLNMDGSHGESAQKCEQFAKDLQMETGLPVELWDERGTTKTAVSYLNATDTRGKKRKNVIDSVAAVIILEDYLAYRKNRRTK